jgi:hypothetical protein
LRTRLVEEFYSKFPEEDRSVKSVENRGGGKTSYINKIDERQKLKELLGLKPISQKERKENVRALLSDRENFFKDVKEICNSDPEHILRLQEELLAEEEVRSTEKKQKPKKGKKGQKKANKGAKQPSASASGATAPSLKKVETRQQLLDKLYQEGPIAEGFVKLHKSMKIWQQKNVERKIREGEKYSELDEAELEKQFLGHFIGMHTEKLFNSKEFKNDFIRGSEGEFIMLCSATLKNGEEIYGKISFLINDENQIFHRMFFKANIKEDAHSFLLKKADVDFKDVTQYQAEEGGGGGAGKEEEEIVGKYKAEIDEEGGSITYTLTDNPLLESYTILSFNK